MRDRMTKVDWVLAPILVAIVGAVAVAAFRLLGFLGIGILGLLVELAAVNVDLERGWPVGPARDPRHYGDRLAAEDRMSRAERAEWRASLAADQLPLFIAKVAGAGLIILGFGLFFLVQLPRG